MACFVVRSSLSVGVLAVGMLGAGCSFIDSAKQHVESNAISSITNTAVSSLTGGRFGLTTSGGQAVATDKGSGTSYIAGENITLPKDFPEEMMVYPNSKILFVTLGAQQALSIRADEYADVVASWYAARFSVTGWKETSKLAAGGFERRSYTKGTVTLSLTYLGSRDSGTRSTAVTITRKVGE